MSKRKNRWICLVTLGLAIGAFLVTGGCSPKQTNAARSPIPSDLAHQTAPGQTKSAKPATTPAKPK